MRRFLTKIVKLFKNTPTNILRLNRLYVDFKSCLFHIIHENDEMSRPRWRSLPKSASTATTSWELESPESRKGRKELISEKKNFGYAIIIIFFAPWRFIYVPCHVCQRLWPSMYYVLLSTAVMSHVRWQSNKVTLLCLFP